MSPSRALLAALVLLPPWPASADETAIVLADDPARPRVQAACSMCHSLDYIEMNSPFLDRAGWEKTVNKMVKVMGAPLSAEQVAEITEYLDTYYGNKPLP
jgi:hypothetical protein